MAGRALEREKPAEIGRAEQCSVGELYIFVFVPRSPFPTARKLLRVGRSVARLHPPHVI